MEISGGGIGTGDGEKNKTTGVSTLTVRPRSVTAAESDESAKFSVCAARRRDLWDEYRVMSSANMGR